MHKPWHWAPVLILLDFLACVQVVIYAITIFLLHQSWLLPMWFAFLIQVNIGDINLNDNVKH